MMKKQRPPRNHSTPRRRPMQRVSTLAITTFTLILLAGNGTAIYAQSSMQGGQQGMQHVSYTHLLARETREDLVRSHLQ